MIRELLRLAWLEVLDRATGLRAADTEVAAARRRDRLTEQGRRLASERDDLIAQGVDPAELIVPLAPREDEQ